MPTPTKWKHSYWKSVYETRCAQAAQKAIAAAHRKGVRLREEDAFNRLYVWLEKESGLIIQGRELRVEELHALIMLMHKRGLTK